MSQIETLLEGLIEEIDVNKNHLISKYIDMLDPKKNDNTDELELLDKFIEYFTSHPNSLNNYIEYMTFLRAYILLCHAAIEDCLEKIAKLSIDISIKTYHEKTEINSILKWFILRLSDHSVKSKFDFNKILKMLRDNYGETLNNNHGIKKHNLQSIFTPIGIIDIDFEPFESFGELRGYFAHNNSLSASRKLIKQRKLKKQTPPNPLDFSNDIDLLLVIIYEQIVTVIQKEIE